MSHHYRGKCLHKTTEHSSSTKVCDEVLGRQGVEERGRQTKPNFVAVRPLGRMSWSRDRAGGRQRNNRFRF